MSDDYNYDGTDEMLVNASIIMDIVREYDMDIKSGPVLSVKNDWIIEHDLRPMCLNAQDTKVMFSEMVKNLLLDFAIEKDTDLEDDSLVLIYGGHVQCENGNKYSHNIITDKPIHMIGIVPYVIGESATVVCHNDILHEPLTGRAKLLDDYITYMDGGTLGHLLKQALVGIHMAGKLKLTSEYCQTLERHVLSDTNVITLIMENDWSGVSLIDMSKYSITRGGGNICMSDDDNDLDIFGLYRGEITKELIPSKVWMENHDLLYVIDGKVTVGRKDCMYLPQRFDLKIQHTCNIDGDVRCIFSLDI